MLDVEGPAAPPRLNGELVFNEPWESRSFAMAMSLVEAGLFTWDDFREHLIEAVQRWEADPDDVYRYYDRWQEALESIVGHQGIVAVSEIEQRATEYELRPPGHDHRHDHGRAHGHGHAHGHDHAAHGHG